MEITIEEAKGRVPVMAGAGGYNTAEVIALAKKLESMGVDGILSVTPYYNKPTQEGVYQHFRAIAAAISIPVMLYSIQGRTQRQYRAIDARKTCPNQKISWASKRHHGNINQMSRS